MPSRTLTTRPMLKPRLATGQAAAEVDVVDGVRVEGGDLVQRRPARSARPGRRVAGRPGTLVGAADGRAGGGDDDCLGHGLRSDSRKDDGPPASLSSLSAWSGRASRLSSARCAGPTWTCSATSTTSIYVDYLQEARVDMLRVHAGDRAPTTSPRASWWSGTRWSTSPPLAFRLRAGAASRCWVTEIRAASFTLAYEVFDETDDGRGVYLRASTVLTPYVFATERPRRLTQRRRETLEGFLEPGDAGPDPRVEPVRRRARALPRARAVLRRRRLRPRQQREVLRVLPGGPDPAARRGSGRDALRRGRSARVVVAQTDVDYSAPILFRPEPYACWSRVAASARRSLASRPRSATGHGAVAGAVTWWSSSTRPPAAGRAAGEPTGTLLTPASGLLEGVDHGLRGVGDVVPELRVLLGCQLDRVEAHRKCTSQRSRASGVTANGACRIRSRGWPRVSEYVVGPPQYCARKSVNRSAAGPRSSSG